MVAYLTCPPQRIEIINRMFEHMWTTNRLRELMLVLIRNLKQVFDSFSFAFKVG